MFDPAMSDPAKSDPAKSDDDLDEVALRCRSDDPGLRRVAMMDCAELVGDGAALLLVEGLRDTDPSVREAAARALDEHEGIAVAHALIEALTDPVPGVRQAAAETLADKKQDGSAPALIEAAGHADPFVSAAALRALREMVVPDALPAALRALHLPAPEVRREVVGVLGWLKAEAALPALMATGADTDPTVRRALQIPALAMGLINGLVFKGRCYSALAQMLGTRSVTQRLAQLLLHLADTYGVPEPDGTLIGAAFSHADLAHMVGATRQWVTISLKRLEGQGIVSARTGRLMVCRPDLLEELREGQMD